MKKKGLILVLVIFTLLMLIQLPVLAGKTNDNYRIQLKNEAEKKYKLDDYIEIDGFIIENRVLINYIGNETEILTMPWHILDIGDYAFKGNKNIKKIVIPEGVGSFGEESFKDCTNLKEIVIPDSVTELGWKTFQGCKNLKKIDIPVGVRELNGKIFEGCSKLQEVMLPKKLTTINERAFYRCYALKTIKIPDTVTHIGKAAFKYCSALKNIQLPKNLKTMDQEALAHCISLEKVEIPKHIKTLEKELFYHCSSLKSIIIPSNVQVFQGINIFYNCNNLIIYGNKNSSAESYAKLRDIPFVKLDNGKVINQDQIYKVTFHGNKGTVINASSKAVVYRNTYGNLPAVKRKGYQFKGWYTKKSNGLKVVKNTRVTLTQNHVLYARWEKVKPPGKSVLKSVKSSGRYQLKFNMKKLKNVNGYEIQYSLNKGFKGSKRLTTKKLSGTIKGLNSKSKYYVRIRAYKLDSANEKVYGKYSNVRTIKIK